MIELALASGFAPSEVEAMGPHGWATLAELLKPKGTMP